MKDTMGDKLSCIVAVFSFLQLAVGVAADSIQGCGGFVEASSLLAKLRRPSDPMLDYSLMTIELHTLDGLIKDRTQCAPNGYYYLPVYDRGTFVLKIKGPEGWTFEPEQVTALVGHNGCNNNDDINFRYTGFTVSGKVLGASGGASCAGTDSPGGVTVTAVRDGEVVEEKVTVVTSPGGSYTFKNLHPGKYKLSASHPKWNVQVKGVPEIELGWGNGVVDDMFFIAGYDIDGSVVSQGNPVLGVEVYLYSNGVQELSCPQGPGIASPLPKKALCHVVSGVDGKFKFSAVPCGHYQLVPFYKGETTVFDISPPSVDIHITHDSVEISKPFQVTGFSVGGRVVDSQGTGVEGVKIVIGDAERATTDSQGYYKLDQVTSTHYNVKARKPHYKFSTLENYMVLPNMASIPDIKATHYAVCGSVNVLSSAHTGVRQVALTHGPPNVKPQTKRSDESGSFCFEVPPGEYRLSPLTTPAENAAGLIFSPPYLDISVYAPVIDAVFVQELASAPGVPIVVGVAVLAIFASMPRLNDATQQIAGTSGPTPLVRLRQFAVKPLNSDIIRYLLFRLRKRTRRELQVVEPGDSSNSQDFYSGLKRELQSAFCIDLRPATRSSWLRVKDQLDDEDVLILVRAFLELDMQHLTYLDLSGNKIGEKSVVALAEALIDMPGLTHLDLSGNQIGEKGVIAIAEVVERGSVSALTWFDLSQDFNCSVSDGERESYALARALKSGHLSRLQHLGLPPCNMDLVINALWEGRLRKLSYLLISGYFDEDSSLNVRTASKEELFSVILRLPLQYIHLRRCGLTWDVMEEFIRALVSGEESAESLEHLDLSENNLGVRGIIALGRIIKEGYLTNLKHLMLGQCGIEDIYQIRALEDGLLSGNLSGLKYLDLSSNRLSFFGTCTIVKVIEAGHLSRLERLNLSDCHMKMAAGLERLRPGKPYRLPYLDSDERDIFDFVAAFKTGNLTRLKNLDLSFNKLSTQGCEALAKVIQAGDLPDLQYLHLNACGIKDDGVVALVDAMGAGQLSRLQYLDLGFNKFGRRGVEAIARALKEGLMAELRFLNLYFFRLNSVPLDREDVACLYEAIYGVVPNENICRIASRERDRLVRISFSFAKKKRHTMLVEREQWVEQMASVFIDAYSNNHDLKATIVGLGSVDAQIRECRHLNAEVPVHHHEDFSSFSTRTTALAIVIVALGIYLYMV
ncbi:hypothetical protein R1sor_003314 [Riccia sorocarpa]|uniref:Uncharacterized protein n=1 Tax=Riccia sorocarpa TaxID=122646 RepID=A0ABD3H180_9MARC